MDWAVTATNLHAYASGAGSGKYTDFIPFDQQELYKMIGVLFANGLTPKPQFDYWFCLEDKEPLLGSNLISNALHRKNSATGKTIKAACRWKHFRRYFTVADYRDSPKLEPKKTRTIRLFLCRLRTVGIVRFPPPFSSSADKITTLVNKITHD